MPVFSRTLTQTRIDLAMAMNDHLPRSGASATAASGSTTTLTIAGEIGTLPAGSLIGSEIYTNGGTGLGQYLRITAHTVSSGTATLTFPTATALSTDTTFEIHNLSGRGYGAQAYNNAIFDAVDAANKRTWSDLSNISLALERGNGATTGRGVRRHEYPLPSGFLGLHSVELLREPPMEAHGIGYINTQRAFGDNAAGDGVGRNRVAQGFQINQQALVSYIAVFMGKVGSPTDNLTCVVETNSSGVPSGTAATTVTADATSDTVAGTTLQERMRFVVFSFTPPILLLENTTYHLTLRRSLADPGSATAYYIVGEDDGNNYADGALSTRSGTTWTAVSGSDLLFAISEQADWLPLARPWWALQEQTTDQLFIRGESWGEGRVVRIRGGAAIARPATDATEVPLDPDWTLGAAKVFLQGNRAGLVVAGNPGAGQAAAAQRLALTQHPARPFPPNWVPVR